MGPVSTCKLFGAVRAVSGIKNAVPLIHGPRGCAYHIGYLLTARGGKRIAVASTELSESDVVFGASDKLSEMIIEVDRTRKPDIIAVMSSCATSIIGEDIGRVADETSELVDAELITVSAGGFESSQGEGYEEVMMALIRKFCRRMEPSGRPSVNIIGEFRGGADLREVRESLSAMGVDVNCVLTSGCSIQDIKMIPAGHLNCSFCDVSGIAPCRFLEENFGTPFIHHPLPIGFLNSLRFYREVLGKLNLDYPIDDVFSDFIEERDRMRSELEGMRVAVVSGPTRAVALTEFITELRMRPVLVAMDMIGDYTLENLRGVPGLRSEVLVGVDASDIEDAVIRTEPELILGGLAETRISEVSGAPLIDVMHGSSLTAGFRGAVKLSSRIYGAVHGDHGCY
ncbi:MAG: nitrogenase component 1 [Methanothermobacter sp.]|nr:nitrogenase component 1 [Methanothermobacter sp.]